MSVKGEMQLGIKLSGRQGTFASCEWFSRRSVFYFILVMLNLQKYRKKILFSIFVIWVL